MRYQHSFWYAQSKEIFEEVLKATPECAIAYSGIAFSPPRQPTQSSACAQPAARPHRYREGQAGRRPRRSANAIISTRSRPCTSITAKRSYRQRVQAYLKAMEALAARYPEDDEAQIAYAITLNVAASPSDKTYANQLKGAALLEPIFRRQPRHARRRTLPHPSL